MHSKENVIVITISYGLQQKWIPGGQKLIFVDDINL